MDLEALERRPASILWGATEGVKRLMDFSANPTREALRAFIATMVVDQSLVTDELVEERFADATKPGAREAMASMGSCSRCRRVKAPSRKAPARRPAGVIAGATIRPYT